MNSTIVLNKRSRTPKILSIVIANLFILGTAQPPGEAAQTPLPAEEGVVTASPPPVVAPTPAIDSSVLHIFFTYQHPTNVFSVSMPETWTARDDSSDDRLLVVLEPPLGFASRLTATHARLEVRMDSLLLSCGALSSPTTCRIIPALVCYAPRFPLSVLARPVAHRREPKKGLCPQPLPGEKWPIVERKPTGFRLSRS